jgi:predicted metalloprotease with PDZ domain
MQTPVRGAFVLVLMLAAAIPTRASAPPPKPWVLDYTIRITDPARRLVAVSARLAFAEPSGPIDLFVTDVDGHYTPGYAQFVDGVALTAPDGSPVELTRPTPNRWRPRRPLGAGAYRLAYTVRVDHASKPSGWGLKETPLLGADGGVLIGAALFVFPSTQGATTESTATPRLAAATIRTTWSLPAGWHVQTPWKPASATSQAPGSLDDLLDNFLVVGPPSGYDMFEATLGGSVVTGAVRRGGWPFASTELWRPFAASIRQAHAVFGAMPAPAYMLAVNPWPGTKATPDNWSSGGGAARQSFHAMLDEKLTAADLATMQPLATLVHETFHWWNPTGLPPAVPEDFYWWHEGVTVYYGYLLPLRAGAVTEEEFVRAMAEAYERGERRNAVRPAMSLVEASRKVQADGGGAYDAAYQLGAVFAFALDVELRTRSRGARSLDDLLRALYRRHAKTGAKFTMADLVAEASALAGSPMGEFFARHVEGHERYDWAGILERAGLREASVGTGRPMLGVSFDPAAARPTVGSVVAGGPSDGTLKPGDVFVSVGGTAVAAQPDYARAMSGRRPGEALEVVVARGGNEVRLSITLGERTEVRVEPVGAAPVLRAIGAAR